MSAEDYINLADLDDLDYMSRGNEEPPPHRCDYGSEVARRNSKTGEYFIGCKKFPACRYSRDPFEPEDFVKIRKLRRQRILNHWKGTA